MSVETLVRPPAAEAPTNATTPEEWYARDEERLLRYCGRMGIEAYELEETYNTHCDPFAHAKLLAEERRLYGAPSEAVMYYVTEQEMTDTLEGFGKPFMLSVETQLSGDGKDILGQDGRSRMESMRRAYATAQKMVEYNSDLTFYQRRAVYEFGAMVDLIEMMRDAPEGTVMKVTSPCEIEKPELARLACGMMPFRGVKAGMAIEQWHRKGPNGTLETLVFSLDNGELDLLGDLPAGARAEDFLGKREWSFAASSEEMRTQAERHIAVFDRRVQERYPHLGDVRQGQFGAETEDYGARYRAECGAFGQAQLEFNFALSEVAGKEAAALPAMIRQYAEQVMSQRRSDETLLLNPQEKALLARLCDAEKVHISDWDQYEALKLLKDIFDTGIQELTRDYFAGDKSALWRAGNVQAFLVTAAIAIEEGRLAKGCGRSVDGIGEGSTLVTEALKLKDQGEVVPQELLLQLRLMSGYDYLMAKWEKAWIGDCQACGDKNTWVGPCDCCAECDFMETFVMKGYIAELLEARGEVNEEVATLEETDNWQELFDSLQKAPQEEAPAEAEEKSLPPVSMADWQIEELERKQTAKRQNKYVLAA